MEVLRAMQSFRQTLARHTCGKSCYLENARSNRLYHLPQELLDHITLWLDESNCSSLQAACRRIGPPKMVSSQGRTQFRSRLYRDLLAWATALEAETGRRDLTELFCGACFESCPRASFTDANANAATPERTCRGASGLFRVYEHISLNFHQMREVPRAKPMSCTERTNICAHREHRRGNLGGPVPYLKVDFGVQRSGIARGPITAQVIKKALCRQAACIYPHLTTASRKVIASLSPIEKTVTCPRIEERVDLVNHRCRWVSGGSRDERNCLTRSILSRLYYNQSLEIIIIGLTVI
jgi:hypothetical protein